MFKLTDNHEFVIKNFHDFQPFSSFLPGIAGENGIPLWAFYVNRGQAMAGFGIRNKDSAITEFFPADKSYQTVPVQGFRTFIKILREGTTEVFEPFSFMRDNETVRETLTIGANHLQLDYHNEERGLQLTVEYFTLPQSPLAGLVREVTLTNTSDQEINLELIDGLATIFPSGLANAAYKELGNTLKSWFDVETINNKFNFYHLRGNTEDIVDVSEIHDGNFYTSLIMKDGKEQIAQPIFDRELIFGNDLTLQNPVSFYTDSVSTIRQKTQISTNKVSSGFTALDAELKPKDELKIVSLIGYGENREVIKDFIHEHFNFKKMAEYKHTARTISDNLTNNVETNTAEPLFDAYVKQNYLDNGLRGGFPTIFKSGNNYNIFYLYSRKHGDLERDYNFFSISPTFYSQGNGNYRDINQNRRLDVLFNPKIKDYNIKHFVNLIQLDGYNPLSVNEVRYTLEATDIDLSGYVHSQSQAENLKKFFKEPFAPGDLLKFIHDYSIQLKVPFEEFLSDLLSVSDESLEADHGEGFWIDHWTYNLDLIDSYLAVYPDQVSNLFFGSIYRYFDSPAFVNPKSIKYQQHNGKLRQYDAIEFDQEKQDLQDATKEQWVRGKYGKGEIYETNLYSKLFLLAVTKTATIAPFGLGVEMEAGKPGWNDALNGLPGMFGAGTSELYELKRLLRQLQIVQVQSNNQVILPEETRELIKNLAKFIEQFDEKSTEEQLSYWKKVTELREAYREAIRNGISGDNFEISMKDAQELLSIYEKRVDTALENVEKYSQQGLVPTYFYFEATGTEKSPYDINTFQPYAVTPFLEGVVKKLKISDSVEDVKAIYDAVRQSDIFDEKLGMYKTSMSISDEPIELGRARFFTPGWLENESVFMHMEYKYLLELLKKGLVDQFFNDLKTALVPFLDPEVYGRSILENSSFIASSANPDPSVHGRGFVARLSGSTVEFLNMWVVMFIGKQPFTYDVDTKKLQFRLQPTLPSWLFKEDGTVSFTLFSNIKVVYYNARRRDTFGKNGVKPVRYTITYKNGSKQEVSNSEIIGTIANDLRNGLVKEIYVDLK